MSQEGPFEASTQDFSEFSRSGGVPLDRRSTEVSGAKKRAVRSIYLQNPVI